jgi:endonuclease YncB( thermonuclease family)
VLLALLAHLHVHADTLLGKVIHVADGDTITVLDESHTQHRIRLSGIDAPESKQAFGHVSRQSLVDQVAGQAVAVQWLKTDKYGRKVGKVVLDGRDINLEQIRRGLAWHYKHYESEQSTADRKAYADAEEQARAAQTGLWRDASPLPPWEFRHGR